MCFTALLLVSSCGDDNELKEIPFKPTAYEITGTEVLGQVNVPNDNPMTVEGIRLGQHLFYDKILSKDKSISCSSCHKPEKAFTDGKAVSLGVNNAPGTRSSMSLVNLAYNNNGFFWNGRSPSLEEQAIHPIEEVAEFNNSWSTIEARLREHEHYPTLFRKAFGIDSKKEISRDLATKALAQFQRAITSFDSKFDRVLAGTDVFNDKELLGYELFYEINLLEVKDAQCGHCHSDKLFTTNKYFNNGLQKFDSINGFQHKGRFLVTNVPFDEGKFRTPTLRNITLTAPYMHDGRLKTLEDVIEHYNSGGHPAKNLDPNLVPLKLTQDEKDALIAFLHTLTDTSYLKNPLLIDPFK